MAATIQDPSLQNNQPTGNNTSPLNNIAQQVNQNNGQQSQQQSNQGVTFNQTPSTGGQGQPQAQDTAGRNKPQGTGFTNVGQFINANQGNQLGQTVQSGIQNTAQKTQQNIGNAVGSFNQGVQSNLLNTDANKQTEQGIIGNASNLQAGQTLDPNQLSQFQNFTAGGYAGPQSLQNADYLQGQAQQAEQLGQQTGSTGGQLNLLQRFVGSPQYTQGSRTLDQLFLAQQPNALNQAKTSTFGLTNQAQQANQNAQQIATQSAAANKQFGQQAAQAATEATNPINTAVQSQLQQAINQENQQATQYGDLQKILGQTAKQYGSTVNALGAPSVQSTGNPAVDQINAILSNLQAQGVDPNTLQQLSTTALNPYTKNTQKYLDLLKGNITQTPGGVTVSNPSDLGTAGFTTNAADLASTANQQAVMNKSQAAQLNALNQLAGNTTNPQIDASGVGTNTGAGVNVNLANILASLPQGSTGLATPGSTPSKTPLEAIGSTVEGIDRGVGNIINPVLGDAMADNTAGLVTAGGQAQQGNYGGAVNTIAQSPVNIGSKLANNLNQNPLAATPIVGGLIGDKVKNPLAQYTAQPIQIGTDIAHKVVNPIASVFGGGGGGKIICNELHRQGYISDYVIGLDEAYGKKHRKLTPEAYLGYLIVAGPIVDIMRKSPLFTKAISKICLPWSSYMANTMDPSIPGSKFGKLINNVSIKILPYVYRIKKSFMKVKREYSTL